MRKMQLDSDIKAAKKMRLPWWGVLCVIIGAMPIGGCSIILEDLILQCQPCVALRCLAWPLQ